ncbi:hypothetical protein D9M68_845810 [compost metagenome]
MSAPFPVPCMVATKVLPLTGYEMSMQDALLAIALADRIHGTDEAIRATAYRVRDKVRIACRPDISRIIRCRNLRQFVTNILREL